MNIFDILCTSARAQNFAGGPGHTGNEVTYTKSHNECVTNFGQYIHVKYHNAVFSIKNTKISLR